MARLYTYNQPEKVSFYLGVISSLLNGTLFPLLGWIMSELIFVLASFYSPEISGEQYREKANNYTLVLVGLALGSFLFYGGQIFFFDKVGQGLTVKLREDVFNKIVAMPMKWFDEPENNPGSLAVKL